eukprot:GHVQ01024494.1.p1 GENE.GHVQ01024494.1~~GHVQ01024494.1.p1  ORF type:complete len:223 (-),score=24.52 GHVQ01024494.1:1251-1919(-)
MLDQLDVKLRETGFNKSYPTLFVAECVLVYMAPSESDALIQWAANAVDVDSAMVVFEQINPSDAFGRTMVRNMEARGCSLLSLPKYPTIDSQHQRYTSLGWRRCSINDMNSIYDHLLTPQERSRIQRLEIFDEIEEWRLIQAHYIILVTANWQRHHREADTKSSSEGDSALAVELPPEQATPSSTSGTEENATTQVNGNKHNRDTAQLPLEVYMNHMDSLNQ